MKLERVYSPTIITFVRDLMFQVRLEEAAHQTGYSIRFIDRDELIPELFMNDRKEQIVEPLFDRIGGLIDEVSRVNPELLIFDLGNEHIPWAEWIEILSTNPATRRIPILAFGSHVDSKAFDKARKAGAQAVFARSRFMTQISALINKYAQRAAHADIRDWCEKPLPAIAIKGLEEFNRGEYFTAHELLETAWVEEKHPGREMYRAILQIAVAYHHVLRLNFYGAVKMFLRVRQWINPLPEYCRGVDINKLRVDSELVYSELRRLGPEKIREFDISLLKPVNYSLFSHDS